jgi:hypothetical protein
MLKKTDTIINKMNNVNADNITFQKWSKQKELAY